MKKLILSAGLLASFAMVGVAQSGAQIEYKMTTTGATAPGSMKMYYATQGSRIEMNMAVPQMPNGGISRTTIIKSDQPNTVYMLDDKARTYSTMETQPNNNAQSDAGMTVKILGKEKIGKYNCTHAQVARGNDVSDYWTTTDIPEYGKYRNNNNSNCKMASEQNALATNGADGLLVKTITRDPRGTEITMELVSFTRKDLPASLFLVPADYKMNASGAKPGAPAIDPAKLQNMTPEERAKYVEELKKQYETQSGNK